ncbi:hypothetical protein, partial [Serratia marcescens]|uniref:hypothetical protein n=2 Tax=Serratia TaxID=613 RepID=UPI00080B802F
MPLVIKYFAIAFVIAFIVVLFNVFSATGEIRSFGQGMSYLFWMTLGPGGGMAIGAALRLWLMPDAIYTREGMTGLLKARLFWLAGPQCIGWLAPSALAGWPGLSPWV